MVVINNIIYYRIFHFTCKLKKLTKKRFNTHFIKMLTMFSIEFTVLISELNQIQNLENFLPKYTETVFTTWVLQSGRNDNISTCVPNILE